jgi:lipopolysaccharide export system permease protein
LKRLNKYLILNILKFLLITQFAGLVMFVTIEFLEHMDLFTDSLNSFLLGLVYILLRIPHYFNLLLPLASLISMLILLILMVRNNEIIAARTSGISTISLMKPFIAFACALIVFSFIIAEWITPHAANAAEYLYRVKIKKEDSYVHFKNDRIWFKRTNILHNIDFYDAKKDIIKGLTVIELADDFTIKKRIDAKEGTWQDGAWLFVTVTERTFANNAIQSKNVYPEMKGLIRVSPAILKVGDKNPEDMGYQDLSKYIRRLKRDGHDVRRYLVDLYNKMAFPFVNLIMVLVAFSVGLRYSKTKHVAKGILVGVCVGVLYWFIHNICLSFGYAETFPPFFAAWLSNIVFFALGIIGVITLRT